jgi:hypothetical protein
MNHPAASSGVSPGGSILFAASGGEFDPERLKNSKRMIVKQILQQCVFQ